MVLRPKYSLIYGSDGKAQSLEEALSPPRPGRRRPVVGTATVRGPELERRSYDRIFWKAACVTTLFAAGALRRRDLFGFGAADVEAEETSPGLLGGGSRSVSTTADEERPRFLSAEDCAMTTAEQDDADRVSDWIWVWETQCTTVGCRSGYNEPCLKPDMEGWLVMYLFGVFYMFVALAIVCDEFFVPSLECFVEEFDISMDVAGATFMAAGGSMPELFTSMIATFKESDVGFAAIVGSAVFNVLFVIAVCALSSKETLVLTWWPLARDCSYYVFTLGSVVVAFQPPKEGAPGEIYWYEALVLFAEYVGYCTLMKFNSQIQALVRRCLGLATSSPVEPTELSIVPPLPEEEKTAVNFAKPSTFRSGILQLLTQNAGLADTVGIAAVTQIKGNLQDTFAAIDLDGDGFIDESELAKAIESLHSLSGLSGKPGNEKLDDRALKLACQGIAQTRDGKITFEAFSKWYIASEARLDIEVRRVFDKFDSAGSGKIDEEAIGQVLLSLGHRPTDEELKDIIQDVTSAIDDDASIEDLNDCANNRAGNQISFEQFERWYHKSLFWERHRAQHKMEEAEEDDQLNLDIPDPGAGSWAWFWFLLTYPLCAVLYTTVPDVRIGRIGTAKRPELAGNWKLAVFEFCLSLLWIGLFAMCLYEWVVVCSNTIGIPSEVSGITIMAAGTSIPDLLSSYIVARQGEGDMAVSSSIGSNIFDVTVGLPLPWLLFTLSKQKPVLVGAGNLQYSVPILIGMLVSVVATIMVCRWRMTKFMGVTMMILYFVFICLDLIQQFPKSCPIWDTQNKCS
eukprot:TRINITY_DN10175_c0_g1_i1.p1 TRINITY_DN10175_c0_g1~~TRINITY_DN10175_c0_g1_i1.p1  ORF type:complete len:796 (+),score=151.98 TRINITY_DN10175_c0_g1_i1:61-2448(+)